ncbi:MAG TPA: 3-oxoacyl-ACP synthase [Candidatus Acidoferrales bacterium]|nr:3-oxoacyl-ACP synthase [Candidatus Acidoferrales bacterium]
MTAVGIVDVHAYSPVGFQTADEIASLSGIPAAVVREKFGLEGKHIAAADEHASDLAAKAAAPILARNPGRKIDALLYMGSPYRDFPVWSAAPRVQQLLGAAATGSLAFDIQGVSCGTPIAMQVAKGLICTNDRIDQVLLAGGSREHDLIDYENERSRFMFNFGAGGAALLLRRDHPENHVLETAGFTDGSFADDVMVPAGGSREPASAETVRARRHSLDVRDPAAMKRNLDPVTADRFVAVAVEAVERSGYRVADIRVLLPIHTKRSLFDVVRQRLGVSEQCCVYLSDHGHMSAIDPIMGLHRARERGLLQDGDLVVMLAAGTGYSWAATAIRWGRA